MLEERLLVFRFNRGDRTVLRRIYEKYKDDLVTLAAALSNDKTTAEDAVHDAFVAFIRSTGSLRLTGSLKGYLARCVVNNVRSRYRTAQRRHDIALDQIGPVPSPAPAESQPLEYEMISTPLLTSHSTALCCSTSVPKLTKTSWAFGAISCTISAQAVPWTRSLSSGSSINTNDLAVTFAGSSLPSSSR